MGKTSDRNKKIKILFLLEAFDKGGIEKVTLDIVNNLSADKYDITVQTFWYGGHCQSQVNENIRVIPFFFKGYVKGIIRLIALLPPKMLHRMFIREKYDIEIGASDGGAAKVISGSPDKNSKKICWVHMDVIARGSKLKEYSSAESARKIYKNFDRIVCVSESAKDKFTQKFGDYPNIVSAHNPLPDKDIKKRASESVPYTKENGIKDFVTVGRLAVEKGFDRLCLSAKKLLDSGHAKFRIHIVGDSERREELEKLISELHIENHVLLHGFQNNPYTYISNSDFYICSSLDEAFPLSVGESLVLGVPVIGTACSGVDEWLECGNAEYGIRTENSCDGVFSALLKCLEMSDSEYNRLKTAAEIKSSKMSLETQLEEWERKMFSEV